MEQKKSPFIMINVTCPICGNAFQSYKLKVGLYAVTEKESDQHPKFYKWTDQEFNALNPTYYSIWRCPQCFFSDFSENYEKRPDSKMLAMKKIYKPAEVLKMPFISEITRYTDTGIPSFETAMNLHLTAAYINEIPSRIEDKSYFKLARLYLRIAWLYREKFGGNEDVYESPKLKQALKAIDEVDANCSRLEASAGKLVNNIKNRLSEIYSGDIPLNNPYYANLGPFLSTMKNFNLYLGKIKTTAVLDQQGKLNKDAVSEGQQPYYNFASYLDFLMNLMPNWPAIPLNEKAALALAVKNYTLSYTNEDIFDTPEKRLNAVDLIEDLYIRLDDYDSALNYVTEIYRSGTKDRQNLYNKMNSKKADGTYPSQLEKDRIESQIARINSTLSRASDKKKDLEEKRLNAALQKLTEIVNINPKITEIELLSKLLEINIPEPVYATLKERSMLPAFGNDKDREMKDAAAENSAENNDNGEIA